MILYNSDRGNRTPSHRARSDTYFIPSLGSGLWPPLVYSRLTTFETTVYATAVEFTQHPHLSSYSSKSIRRHQHTAASSTEHQYEDIELSDLVSTDSKGDGKVGLPPVPFIFSQEVRPNNSTRPPQIAYRSFRTPTSLATSSVPSSSPAPHAVSPSQASPATHAVPPNGSTEDSGWLPPQAYGQSNDNGTTRRSRRLKRRRPTRIRVRCGRCGLIWAWRE